MKEDKKILDFLKRAEEEAERLVPDSDDMIKVLHELYELFVDVFKGKDGLFLSLGNLIKGNKKKYYFAIYKGMFGIYEDAFDDEVRFRRCEMYPEDFVKGKIVSPMFLIEKYREYYLAYKKYFEIRLGG